MPAQDIVSLDSKAPLHEVIGVTAAFWIIALLGHHTLLPALGYTSSYITSPVANALYYALFSVLATVYFWRLFRSWATSGLAVWRDLALSLTAGVAIILGIWLLGTISLSEQTVAVELFFATPWYFLPKAFDVLFQQILIATLILELYARTRSLEFTRTLYGILFVGAHIALFSWNGAPLSYAVPITLWSIASAYLFPTILLRVRGGFIYTYSIHLISYLLLATLLRTWPPSGYPGI